MDTIQGYGPRTGPFAKILRPLIALVMIASMAIAALPAANLVSAQDTDSLAAFIPADSIVMVEANLDPTSTQMTLASELFGRADIESLIPEAEQGMLQGALSSTGGAFDGKIAAFVLPTILNSESIDEVISDSSELQNDLDNLGGDIPSGWAIILQPSDPDAVFAMIQEQMASGSDLGSTSDESAAVQTETYGGFDILSVAPSDDDSGQAVALVNGAIVIGTVGDDVKSVIDVVNGDTPAITTDENFSSVRAALPSDVIVFGYVNGPAVTSAISALNLDDADEVGGLAEIPEEVLTSINAHEGFVVWVDEHGFRFDSVAIPVDSSELPTFDPYTPTFTDIIPSDAMFYAGSMNLGATPGMDTLALMLAASLVGIPMDDMSTPVDVDDIFAQAEAVVGFNIKTDLLDQLTGEWALAGSFSVDTGAGLFISNVSDPETVTKVVDQVTMLISQQLGEDATVSTKTVDGDDVTVVTEESNGTTLTFEIGMIGGTLAIGLNGWTDLLETPAADPLSASTGFTESLGYLANDNVTGLIYINLEELMPIITDSLGAFSSASVPDNDPSCGDYATQEEAQAAYDDDAFSNYLLDLDWDGVACEDYFAPATPEETTAEVTSPAITALTVVSWAHDDMIGVSGILVIQP